MQSLTRQIHTAWFVLLTIVFPGCAARAPRPRAAVADRHPDYVDLQAGWRIRVVIPLTKSGKYKVETSAMQATGNTIEVKASDDLLGYEEDFYEVKPHEPGVAIHFKAATAHMVNGTSTKHRQPKLDLLQLPETLSRVRLIFLTRESVSDYDGAILAASSIAALDTLTRQVEGDPASKCVTTVQSICRWIPPGISVQPQANTERH